MKRFLAFTLRVIAPLMLSLMPLASAYAGCSSAFCPVNTQWEVQGAWTKPGARVDLRHEYIDQDQPRHGNDQVDLGEIKRHHDEVRTVNKNWLLDIGYTFSPQWGVSVMLPYIDRDHDHVHNHRGAKIPEAWDIQEFGDARVLGRYQFQETSANLLFGVKLPTGQFDVTNQEGSEAERSLQPGTGTTDMLLGLSHYQRSMNSPWSWFAQGLWQRPLNERNDYQSGYQLGVDGGARYALTPNIGLMAQINALSRGRDRGDEAEPEDTGGRFLFFTPGVSMALSQEAQLYAFIQQPLYQRVHGVQLTADRAYTAGVSFRF